MIKKICDHFCYYDQSFIKIVEQDLIHEIKAGGFDGQGNM